MKKLVIIAILAICLVAIYTPKLNSHSAPNVCNIPLSKLATIARQNGGKIPHDLLPKPTQTNISTIGTQPVLVLPMQFPDVKNTFISETLVEKFSSETHRSLRNYYKTASFGKHIIDFGPNGIINKWMMMPHKYFEHYFKGNWNFGNLGFLMKDAYDVARKEGIDFSYYDQDNNGYPDITIFVWAGNSWTVGGSMPGDFMSRSDYGTFISIGEDVRTGGLNPITVYHEYFHAIGLPDLYDYADYYYNVGGWDLMGEGVWDGYCGLTAFQRWHAGWIEAETITKPGEYTIDDLNGTGQHKMYKVPIPGSETEWICIENRQRHGGDGFFHGCPTDGLVMYRVDDKRPYGHGFNTFDPVPELGISGIPGFRCIDGGGSRKLKSPEYGANLGRTEISDITTPNTLPLEWVPETFPKLRIYDISKIGPVMTFKVEYTTPQTPIAKTEEKLIFGKVPKNSKKTLPLKFTNVGVYQLVLKLDNSQSPWVTTNVSNFLGNDYEVQVTVDTATLKYGINEGKLIFRGSGTDGENKFVTITVEVTSVLGDINMDEKVDKLDFELLTDSFGYGLGDERYNKYADLDNNGKVDALDVLIFARQIKTVS
jgi:M6 family metalloprotease-like protein